MSIRADKYFLTYKKANKKLEKINAVLLEASKVGLIALKLRAVDCPQLKNDDFDAVKFVEQAIKQAEEL